MDLYLVSLATGAIGLGVMAFGGLSHGGHGGAHGGHGHAGPGHGGHGHGGNSHAGAAGGHAAHGGAGREQGVGISPHTPPPGWNWGSLLSPRVLFSVMVGFGAGGIAATPLGEPFRLGAAILAGVAFETLAVGPLWRFLFRFESRPATTLESAIEDEARAVTGFDANGNGLVALEVDGQVIQLLATLSSEERARGLRVHSGDMVRVAEVDAARGRCTVTAPTR